MVRTMVPRYEALLCRLMSDRQLWFRSGMGPPSKPQNFVECCIPDFAIFCHFCNPFAFKFETQKKIISCVNNQNVILKSAWNAKFSSAQYHQISLLEIALILLLFCHRLRQKIPGHKVTARRKAIESCTNLMEKNSCI